MSRSVLVSVARAAGLSGATRKKPSSHGAAKAKARARSAARPVAAAKAAPLDQPRAPVETAEARSYAALLQSLGHEINSQDRQTIIECGSAWESSAEIRSEFMSFAAFAAFTRARQRQTRKP